MMKFSLLQSLFFFTIIFQACWCLASESSNGEKMATLPRPQAEEGTTKDVGLGLPQHMDFSSFWGLRKVRCAQTSSNHGREPFSADVPNAKYSRKLRKVVTLQTMNLSHKGGAGGGGGGGGGVGGAKGVGGGSQSNHQPHDKKNNAISLAYPWIHILLEIGIYAIAALPFTLI